MRIAIAGFNRAKKDAIGNYVEEIKKIFKNVDVLVQQSSEYEEDKKMMKIRGLFPFELGFVDAYYAKKIDERYDYLWLNWFIWNAFGPVALKLKKCKLILDYHGITPEKYVRNPVYKLLLRQARMLCKKLEKKAWKVIVHSKYMKKELGSRKAVVVPLPIIKRRKGRGKKKDYLLYVGRVSPHKRIDVIIKALGSRELKVVGNVSRSEYRGEKKRLEKLAKRIGAKVVFLGAIDDEKLNDYYKQAFAFVTASEHEGFCVPVLEAMSQGTPVIGANAAALKETIGDCGLLFKPGDSKDLKKKIKMLEDKKVYEKMVKAGLKKARKYSLENFRKIIKNVIA